MKIMPNRMDRGFYQYQKEFEDKALEVLRSGWYVLRKEVSLFEEEFASYVGTKYCVGSRQYIHCNCNGNNHEWSNSCIY